MAMETSLIRLLVEAAVAASAESSNGQTQPGQTQLFYNMQI